MTDRQIIYEPHPVSAERKAELREQGYTIIDARYKPADAEPVAETAVEKAPRGRRAKNGE
jgi:hypothetical protein